GHAALGLQRKAMAFAAAERNERLQVLQGWIAAGQRDQHGMAAGKLIHARHDLGRGHRQPFVTVFWQHRIQRVAPTAAIIAAASADEHGRATDERAFALYRRPEDFTDADAFLHGWYWAQAPGVSLTRTAMTSGQRCLHQS